MLKSGGCVALVILMAITLGGCGKTEEPSAPAVTPAPAEEMADVPGEAVQEMTDQIVEQAEAGVVLS